MWGKSGRNIWRYSGGDITVHIELDIVEIMVLITWWITSKWLARFVILGLIGKLASAFKKKGEEKLGKLKEQFDDFHAIHNEEGDL